MLVMFIYCRLCKQSHALIFIKWLVRTSGWLPGATVLLSRGNRPANNCFELFKCSLLQMIALNSLNVF